MNKHTTMAIKLKPLHEQVMVITGDSSRSEFASLRAAAWRGAKLVLVKRKEYLLAITMEK